MTNNGQDLSNFSMLDLFRMEVETQAAILNENLLTLEKDPGAIAVLEALMRAAHSIKGAARIVDLEAAVKVAHVMEDCFVAAQTGLIALDTEKFDILLHGVDLLLRISQVLEADLEFWLSEHHNDIEALATAIATLSSTPTVAIPSKLIQSVAPLPDPIAPSAIALEPAIVVEEPSSKVEERGAEESLFTTISPPRAAASLDSKTTLANSPANSLSERVVRVSADNLNRLMGLAGESLIAANWLQPFTDSLLQLRTQQAALSSSLEKLQESLAGQPLNQQSETYLNHVRQQASECRQVLSDRLNEVELFSRRSTNLADRLYREVIASHMRPFADGVQVFPRMVRDLARQLGKQVKLEVLGKATKVDRDILEKLEAPLTHLLRNAVDHGIESVEERLAAGKTAEGWIKLEAVHRAGMLSITVSDDGRGIHLEQLRQTVVERQLVSAEMAHQLTETELLEFLFLPGFSTGKTVTEISGRGVGLDVVQSMVQEVGGSLRAVSRPGKGMSFHLQLPLTLSVIRTLLVEIAGEPYAFPLTRIDRIVMLDRSAIALTENRQYFTLDGQNIGLVAANQVLELQASSSQNAGLPTLVISDRLSRYGLVVDRFLSERDLVIRPLDARLGKVKNISAAALLEDGAPVLLIDVEDLVRSIDHLLTSGQLGSIQRQVEAISTVSRRRILVVDDSITVREMERKLLQNKGYEVEVAVNGMDGWNAIRTGHYDLVITDVDMPRMNGIELVSQIRNHSNLKALPVIIVSYKDREEDHLRGLEVGANYYLTKSSFHDDTFLTAVLDLIGEATA